MQCRGYVRTLALSVNQLVHVPLAGDFQLSQICSCERPHALGTDHSKQQRHAVGIPTDMETEGPGATVLATADPEQQETLIRENEADTLAGEQTWPTEEVTCSPFASILSGGIVVCGVCASAWELYA